MLYAKICRSEVRSTMSIENVLASVAVRNLEAAASWYDVADVEAHAGTNRTSTRG